MADKQRIIDALLYEGLHHLYTGDLLYDAGIMLQNSVNAEEYRAELKDTIRSECLSQLPEEDFFMRKYLTKTEATELQNSGELLTKDQLINKIKDGLFIINPDPCFVIKIIDYRGNRFAPDPFAYYVSYKDILGQRVSGIYWADSIGFQGI